MAEKQTLASTSSEAYHTVFIDTSLDTHLAIIVSDLDTVSDLKRKIEKEYPLCFPNVGKITIGAVKVKRRGHLYHLSDSMHIKSAFLGIISVNWFLRVDVSSLEVHDENKHLHNPDFSNLLICNGITNNTSVDGVDLSLDSPRKGINDPNNEIEVPQKHVDLKNNTSKNAANRKRKNEHGLGDESLLKEKDVFKLHVACHHCGGNSENNENAALDSLTTKTMDDDQLLWDDSSSLNTKRKKIRESSKLLDQAVTVVPSSGKDVLEEDSLGSKAISHKDFGEPNVAFAPGQGGQETTPSQLCGISLKEKHCDSIQEKKNNAKPSAIDIDITKSNAGTVLLSKSEATAEQTTSEVKKVGNSNDRSVVHVEGELSLVFKHPNNLQMDVELSNCENISTDQSERVVRALSQKIDYEGMQSEKCKSICQDQTEENIRNMNVISEFLEENTPRKSSKSRKKSRKIRVPVGEILTGSGGKNVEGSKPDISSAEPHEAVYGEQSSIKSKKEVSNFSQTNDEEISKVNTESTSLVRKTDDNIRNEVGTVQEMSNTQGNAEIKEEKARKKSKKKHKSTEKNLADLMSEDQNVFQSSTSTDKEKEVEASSNLNGTKLGLERFDNETGPVPHQPNLESAKCIDVQSQTLDHSDQGKAIEVNVSGGPPNSSCQMSNTQAKAENKEEKVRKKSKKKHKSTKKNLADLISEDQNVFQSSTSTDKEKEVEASSNLNGTKLGLEKFEDETGPVPHQPNLESAKCTDVQSQTLDHSDQGKAIKVNVSGGPPNSSCQTSNTQAKAENKEEQVRKKRKKKRKTTEKNHADLIAEGQNVFHQSSTTSADNEKELEASSYRTKKTKLEETDFKSNLNGTELGLEKFEDETGGVPHQPNLESAKCTNVQSHTLDHSYQGMPVEVNVTGSLPNSSCADEAKNCLEISEGNRINVEKRLPCHEVIGSGVVIIDKEAGADRGDNSKAKKSNKKFNLHSTSTSLDLQGSLKSNDKQGIGQSRSEDKSDESVLHSEKKLPKTSRGEAKAPALDMSDKLNSISEEARRENVANVSKTNNHSDKQNNNSFVVSNSVLERPKNTVGQNKMVNKRQLGVDHSQVANGKVSGKDGGEVVNTKSLEQKKRLLGKSGSIFKDDSSGSSEEENGDDGSDTSTRTPSDHSLSSDYSDGQSNANMNSPRNGSIAYDRKRGGRRIITKSEYSDEKNLRTILKSSRRYKTAIETASQLELENDSEPVEVVPDSQAN